MSKEVANPPPPAGAKRPAPPPPPPPRRSPVPIAPAPANAAPWPEIPATPVDTWSAAYKFGCLAQWLCTRADEEFEAWQTNNRRLAADLAPYIAHEKQLRTRARELLLSRPHADIRAWLETLPHPHRSAWATRFNHEKQQLKENATDGQH